GAPLPLILATEGTFSLCYYLEGEEDRFAVIEFKSVLAHCFGGPNDEALNGHPLYERGLLAYGVFAVFGSAWLRAQGGVNRVHPSHSPAMFAAYRHFIFTFHETPLELLAHDLQKVTVFDEARHDRVAELVKTADPGKRSWIE